MFTIGLDVHQSRSSLCVLDAQGKTLRQTEVKGGLDAVVGALAALRNTLPGPLQVLLRGLQAQFERFARGDRTRKKIAVVAQAHRLARIMLAMLRTGQAYRGAAADPQAAAAAEAGV